MKKLTSYLFKFTLITLFLIRPVFAQTELQDTEPKTQTVVKKPAQKKVDTTAQKSYQKNVIDTVPNLDFSLNGQYNYMLSRSKSYNGYKLINTVRLASVWKSVNDTLKKERGELKQAKAKIQALSSSVSTIKESNEEKDSALKNVSENAAQITFLGIGFSQVSYHLLVWMIIAVLVVILIIVIATSRSKIDHVKNKAELYDEVSAEYQAYKTKANEKERKLARELQDERNALEELRNKGKK